MKKWNHKVSGILLVFLFLFSFQQSYAQPGIQWEFSRNITLAPVTPMADFQIKIEINGAAQHAHMKANGGDLRFWVGNVECSYWIERFNNAGKSVIWVKVPASNTSAITMYYGNPAANTTSSGENTFDFFDGFDGNALSNKWEDNSEAFAPGTITVSGGKVDLANKGGYTSMYAKYDTMNLSDAYVVELKHQETGFFRNRFYVTDIMREGERPTPEGIESGFWSNSAYGSANGNIQWSWYEFEPVTANIDYLMRWDITRSSGSYAWSNYNWDTNIKIEDPNNKIDPIEFPAATIINISVTDQTYQSTIVDWVRIRKAGAELTGTIGVETVRVPLPVISTVSNLTGCEGEMFSITGTFPTNFARTVKIGGVVMEIVTGNATTITAKFGTVSGDLTVTTSAGASNGIAVTSTALPVVNVGSPLPSICSQGTSAVLGGTVTGGTGAWTVDIPGGTFNASGNFTTTTWTAPAGYSGLATFTLTGTNGSCTSSAPKTMMVYETPAGIVTVSGDKEFCVGEAVTFTAPAGFPGYEFLITEGTTTTTINNGNNAVYTANNLKAGAIVKVRVTNNNCIVILDTEPFTVNAIPAGDFTSSDASGNTPNDNIICEGEAINFAFSAPGFLKYAFILNGIDTLQNTNASYLSNVTNLKNGDNITLQVTGTGGCSKLFGPVTVTVKDNPTGALSSNKPGNAICVGGSITFSASAGFQNYEFFLNGDSKKNTSSPSYTPLEALVNLDNVAVRLKDNYGCYLLIDPIEVTVNPLPAKPTILTGAQPTTFCVGDGRNINLSVNVPEDPDFTYQWYKNGTPIVISNATLLLGQVAETGVYTVSFKNENGCLSPQSDPVEIIINPDAVKPTVTLTGPQEFCFGGSVTLTSSLAKTYQWYFRTESGSLTPITGANSQTITVAGVDSTGYYAVGITNANGCAGAAQSTPVLVTINALPVTPVITISNGNLTYCVGENVTLSAPTGNAYRWYKDGVIISSATGQNYTTAKTVAAAGIYTVEVKNAKCWSATSEGKTIVVNPLPEPTIIGPATICLNTSGNEYSTETGMTGYIWTIVGGSIDLGQTTNAITVSWNNSGGTKSLNVVYTDGNTCTSNKKATFANSPLVKPTILGTKIVCVGASEIEYTTEGDNNTDYDWTISAGGTITSGSTTNTIKVSWSIAGPQTISVNYTNENNCNAPSPTVYAVTVNPVPIADFSYSSTPYCSTVGNISPVLAAGAKNGAFSFSPAGLNMNAGNGVINIAGSTPGTYTVTNTIVAAGGCSLVSATTEVTITALPAATISYAASPFCSDDNSSKDVTLVGTSGGTFTAPAGLSIIPETGIINPFNSTPGSYKVTYTIPALAGCPQVIITTPPASPVVITKLPTISLAYPETNFCQSDIGTKKPSLIGSTGNYAGGTYSVFPAGLNIDPVTGYFTPNGSGHGNYTVTYTIPASTGCGEVSKETTVIITEVPSALIAYTATPYCQSETTVEVVMEGHAAYEFGTFSSTIGLSINPSSGIINPSVSTAGTYIVTYTIPASGGCAAVPVTSSITISPKPEVTAGTNWATCVGEGPVNITQGADTTFAGSILWSGGSGTWSQETTLTQATYQPAPGETGEITLTLTATGRDGCSSNSASATKKLIINTIPAPVYIVPENAPALCIGGIQSFISVKNNVSDFTSGLLTSSSPGIDIPDNSTAGVSKSINVSGIPANAVITSVVINFNVSHTYNGDLTINLKAANNKVLNIANSLSGPGFENTTISSAATNPIQTSGDIGPYTGTYAAQMRYGTQGATSVPGNRAFAQSFDELFSNPNGNWILSVRDGGEGDYGTFNSWSVTINYSTPVDPIPVLWTINGNEIPDNLYLDASATIPYTGDARAVVYSKPAESGSFLYTATSVSNEGCRSTKNVTLTINPSPKVYIKADYCSNAADGKIRLDAMGVSNAINYNWSTGETSSFVLVDIAHEYYVSVTNVEGCIGTGILSVAEELVVNGDFEEGNSGFYSEYLNKPMPDPKHPFLPYNTGLVDEGTYAVDTSAYDYHLQFHGRDHTTSEQKGKFLIVNGKSDLVTTTKYPASHTRIIWEQTVSVLPNTDYYFSAWAMNFSGIGSTTRLQFEVNGMPVGTVAELKDVASPSNEDNISISNWVRFYNGNNNGIDETWNSGNNSEAIIRIVNLSNVESGNDFGLDDISFGTLAPFVSGPDVSGRDVQTICVGESIQPIVYKVGSGDEPVDGLPSFFKSEFDGLNFTISGGTMATPGVYEYVLTTTGSCPIPATATGKITVVPNPEITLTSITTDAALCLNSNLPSPITYTVSGTTGDAVFTGLPMGLTGTYNTFTKIASISGSASVTGSFNYKLKTAGICKADSISGVISVDALPVAGTISSPAVCLNDDGVVKVTGYSGNILGWSMSDDGVIYTPISNTGDTEGFTNITQTRYYKVEVGNGVCSPVSSVPVTVSIQNLWEGKLSAAWDNPFNWSSKNIPALNTAVCGGIVTIPKIVGMNNDPILTTTAGVTNLNVLSGGNLTIQSGGNLQIAGNIMNSGIINARNGGIEYTGSSARTIESNIFLNNAIGDLKISTSNVNGVTLNAPIDIYRSLEFGANGKKLTTNDQLTLKSTKEETAWLGNMTGKTISGKATVERYINTGITATGGHRKSWQLLATPTIGQTIKDSWQEGAMSNGGTPIQNLKPGYGTLLTTGYNNVPTNGFDLYTGPGPSIKTYNSITGDYDKGPVSTTLPIYNPNGYMILVRGDRSVYTSNSPETPTVLRTKGTFITGDKTISIPANSFASIGNPYASAIEINKLIKSPGMTEFVALWDPLLGGSYGLGGFVTLAKSGSNYIGVPSSGSYSGTTNYIQSGQAFMIQTKVGQAGSITFTEGAKASGSQMVMRKGNPDVGPGQLRTNLYGLNADGSDFITDGTLHQFSSEYSNEIDGFDARKMSNTSENLAIKTNGKLIVIERRQPLLETDTLFFNLTGVRVQKYRLEFIARDLGNGNLQGFIEDLYLGSKIPLNMNGKTQFDFQMENKPGSYAADRFRIVFKSALGPLPVTFAGINATQTKEDILVKWDVENEINILGYDVEKSIDGVLFAPIFHMPVKKVQSYNWLDKNTQPGNNYYRINAFHQNGKTELSKVVKVVIQEELSKITVYPNPITNGIVNVHLVHQPSGQYKIRLLNPVGQVILNKIVTHVQGDSMHPLKWDYNMARGMYQIEVTKPDGGINLIKVVY